MVGRHHSQLPHASILLASLVTVGILVLPAQATESRLIQAVALLKDKNFSEAKPPLEELCPGSREDVSRGAGKGSIPCQLLIFVEGEQVHPLSARDASNLYWLQGQKAEELGDHELGAALYQVSVARDPSDVASWYALAMALRTMSRLTESDSAFEAALRVDPDDTDSLYWLATNLIDQLRHEEADGLLNRVLKVDPGYARAWFRIGEIQMKQGHYDTAIDTFKKARSKGVDRKMVRERIEQCERALAQQK